MATFESVRAMIQNLPDELKEHTPDIVAETATDYFKESFTEKGFNGQAWPSAKNPLGVGSLMVRSGQLMASIRPSKVETAEVVISGGSPSVPYGKIHNEGGVIKQTPTAKQRRFLWAMEHKNNPRDENTENWELGNWGKTAMAKELNIKIPQRQFMGDSPELNERIIVRLELLVKELIKQ